MLKILNAPQIQSIDNSTIKKENIPSIDLMERASLAFYEEVIKLINPLQTVYIFAGPGNNGGDALAVARMLQTSDIKAKVFIVNPSNKLSQDCIVNKERLERLTNIYTITQEEDIPAIEDNSIIIDGLFGSGLNRPLEGVFAAVVKKINQSDSKVYAIDMPSGLYMEDNSQNDAESIIKADYVFTFQLPKLALLLPESDPYYQKINILDIELSEEAIANAHTDYFMSERTDISNILKPRRKFSHKGNYGHAFLLCGSKGKMGAAVLASQACLRTGVGLLTVHTAGCGTDILQSVVPEAMVDTDANDNYISEINIDITNYTIGIGSGIGIAPQTKKALAKLFEFHRKPMVIDADALNIISSDDLLKHRIPPHSILTPHPLEFERLIRKHCKNGYDRLQNARDFAANHNMYLILKGAFTAIITPEKQVYFNPTGNPGMATGGSGDTLTGILTSLLAQQYTPFEASLLGVYLHGLAGDLAAKANSQRSLLPSDIIKYIGKAYRIIEKNK